MSANKRSLSETPDTTTRKAARIEDSASAEATKAPAIKIPKSRFIDRSNSGVPYAFYNPDKGSFELHEGCILALGFSIVRSTMSRPAFGIDLVSEFRENVSETLRQLHAPKDLRLMWQILESRSWGSGVAFLSSLQHMLFGPEWVVPVGNIKFRDIVKLANALKASVHSVAGDTETHALKRLAEKGDQQGLSEAGVDMAESLAQAKPTSYLEGNNLKATNHMDDLREGSVLRDLDKKDRFLWAEVAERALCMWYLALAEQDPILEKWLIRNRKVDFKDYTLNSPYGSKDVFFASLMPSITCKAIGMAGDELMKQAQPKPSKASSASSSKSGPAKPTYKDGIEVIELSDDDDE